MAETGEVVRGLPWGTYEWAAEPNAITGEIPFKMGFAGRHRYIQLNGRWVYIGELHKTTDYMGIDTPEQIRLYNEDRQVYDLFYQRTGMSLEQVGELEKRRLLEI